MWRTTFHTLLNILIPPRLTERVVQDLSIDELMALKALSPITHGAVLPYHHEGVTALVWELKYHANHRAAALAGLCLQEELFAIAAEEVGKPILIPIPMHAKRKKTRGHNQTETLCKAALAEMRDAYEYMPSALVRTRHTIPQQGLKKEKRLTNVQYSMRAPEPEIIKNRVCVIVDDVSTTGATLHEAKRALLEVGAARVVCVSLAAAL